MNNIKSKLITFQNVYNLSSLDFYNTYKSKPTRLSYIPIDVVNEWLDCCNKYVELSDRGGLADLDKEMYKEG